MEFKASEKSECFNGDIVPVVVKTETDTTEAPFDMENNSELLSIKSEDLPDEKVDTQWENVEYTTSDEADMREFANICKVNMKKTLIDDDLLMAIGLVCCAVKLRQRKNKKRKWSERYRLDRELWSPTDYLGTELKLKKSDWYNILCIDEDCYRLLLKLVTPFIRKSNTCMRRAITPHERLVATLHFLATGQKYRSLNTVTHISHQALTVIIPETCKAIYQVLKEEFFKFPSVEDDWKKIAEEFDRECHFPHCLGAINGKHVQITPPAGSGSRYYNHMGYHSLVLMAIVNAKHEFVLCDFGSHGNLSGAEVLEKSSFYSKLVNKSLNLPPAEVVSRSAKILPYVFVGNCAFKKRPELLCSFDGEALKKEHNVFNSQLSKTLKVADEAFDILADRFKVLQTNINLHQPKINSVVIACCILHNYFCKTSPSYYMLAGYLDKDVDDITCPPVQKTKSTNVPDQNNDDVQTIIDPAQVRELFVDYFCSERMI